MRRSGRSDADPMEARASRLLSAVLSGREDVWSPINGDERDIVNGAQEFRDLDSWSRGKAGRLIENASGWMQKQEILRFLSTVDKEDGQRALNLVEYVQWSDLSYDSGVLDRIMTRAKTENVPPEWIAAETLNDLPTSSTDDSPGGMMLDRRMLQ